jgi:molybdate transport system regulatory protein
MKPSARNQLRGTVTRVHKGAVNADVLLDHGGGVQIFANITNEAVDDLGLKPGKAVTALIKSSFILLSPDENIRISARNRLPGTITAVIPGAVNAEVKLKLASGDVLNAIVTMATAQEFGLATGQRCTALIKSSHVILAVED